MSITSILVAGSPSAAFSPASLFAAGEQGVWYDSSDLTTMFEDTTAITPVHTPGNGTGDSPVGLILDKRNTGYSGAFSGGYFTATYNATSFDWWTTDFTIEGWFYASSFASFSRNVVGNFDPSTGYNYWSFGPNSSNQLQFDYYNGSVANFVYSPATLATGSWNHCAMTKTSGGITLFVNGVATSTTAISGTPQSGASIPTPLCIGKFNGTAIAGSISNLRVVKGTAVYSGNFTPPTAPLTAIANTKLLMFGNTSFSSNPSFTLTGSYSAGNLTPFNASVLGNHATQTVNARRPTLSAKYNLFQYTEKFDNAYWIKSEATAVADQTTAPDGTSTGNFLRESTANTRHIFYYAYTPAPLNTNLDTPNYTLSVCAKAGTRNFFYVQIGSDNGDYTVYYDLSNGTVTSVKSNGPTTGTSNSITSLGNGWYRCTITRDNPSNYTTYPTFGLSDSGNPSSTLYNGAIYTGNGTSGLYVWGADMRQTGDGYNLPVYQKVVDAATYTSTGFPYYLNGASKAGLLTSSINFAPATAVSTWASVRKLTDDSDGGTGVITEFSSTSDGTNGAFGLFAPNYSKVANSGSFLSRGTGSYDSAATTTAFTDPSSKVVTGLGNISAPSVILRLNGTQVGSGSASQGGGTYGNYPLYVFSRTGDSTTFPFKGRIYGLIIRAGTSTATQISNTESWLNGVAKIY